MSGPDGIEERTAEFEEYFAADDSADDADLDDDGDFTTEAGALAYFMDRVLG